MADDPGSGEIEWELPDPFLMARPRAEELAFFRHLMGHTGFDTRPVGAGVYRHTFVPPEWPPFLSDRKVPGVMTETDREFLRDLGIDPD